MNEYEKKMMNLDLKIARHEGMFWGVLVTSAVLIVVIIVFLLTTPSTTDILQMYCGDKILVYLEGLAYCKDGLQLEAIDWYNK